MRDIYDFINGDIVVRISPSKLCGDRSYMGQSLIFVGITNGQIYLKRTDEVELRIYGDKLLSLSLDMWDEGWNYYVDPNSLLEDESSIVDIDMLEIRLKNAIDREDYELASKIKSLIDKSK